MLTVSGPGAKSRAARESVREVIIRRGFGASSAERLERAAGFLLLVEGRVAECANGLKQACVQRGIEAGSLA